MGDRLLPLPLTERSVHLRGYATDFLGGRFLADALDGQGLAGHNRAREPSSREDRFHPVHSAHASRSDAGWQRYYTRWRVATRKVHDPPLLELMPPLAAVCPPATVIDKTHYSAFAEPRLIEHLRRRETDELIVSGSERMFVSRRPYWCD